MVLNLRGSHASGLWVWIETREIQIVRRQFGFLGFQSKLTSPLHANLGIQYLIEGYLGTTLKTYFTLFEKKNQIYCILKISQALSATDTLLLFLEADYIGHYRVRFVILSVCLCVRADFSAVSGPNLTKLAEWFFEIDAQMRFSQILKISTTKVKSFKTSFCRYLEKYEC